MLASRAAIAIDNARLFEQARQEIVERRQAEEALLKSKSDLQAVLQSTADGILAIGSKNEVLYANERFTEMWRISQAIMASKDDSVLLQHVLDQLSDPQSFLKQVQQLYRSKKKSFDTLQFKDGRVFERLSYALLHGTKVRGRVWSFRDITARKQAEEALSSSEAELRALFASMHDVVLVIDRLGVYLKVAPTNPGLLARPPEELVGSTLRDVFPSDQADTFLGVVEQVLDTKKTAQIEYSLVFGDRTVWFETSISPMTKDSTLWVAHDISDRKQAEESLRQTTNLLGTIFAGLNTMVAYLDKDFNFLRVNQAYASIENQTPEYFIGKNHFDLYPNQENEAIFKEVVRTGRPYTAFAKPFEYARNLERGISFWDWTVSPIMEEGKVTNLILSVVDVTTRLQAEDARRQAEIRYASLFEQTHDAIFILDLKGHHLDANPRAAEMLGYTPDELLKLSFKEISAQSDESQHILERLVAGEHIPLFEGNFLKKNGEVRPVEINVELVRDINGQPLHIQSVVRDITERKQEEKVQTAMYRLAQAAVSTENFEELYHSIHGILGELMPVDNFYIALYDPLNDLLSFPYFVDQIDDQSPSPQKPSRGLTEYVLRSGRPLLASPEVFDQLVKQGETELVGIDSVDWLGVPLQVGSHIIGVMVTQSYTEGIRLGQKELELFEFVSTQVATAIERKRTEDALRESEDRYRQLVERTPNGILIHVDGQIVYANATSAKMLGSAKAEDLVGKHLLDFVHPDYQKVVKGRVKQLVDNKKEVPLIEEKLVRLDGTVIDAEVTAIPFVFENRNAVQVVFNDITERKRAEAALNESQKSYQSLVEQVPGVIYRDALDEKATTFFISPQIKDLTGYAPDEWMTDPDLWTKLLHPEDRPRILAENHHHLATGEPFKSDYRLLARDGRVVWVRDEAVTICDSSGKPQYDQGVFTDITERKLAEDQVRLSEERYRMLAENMSDAIWLMDLSLRTTYISPSVTRMRGFTLEELTTIPLDQQMSPDSLERALQLFAEILSPESLAQSDRQISRTIELEVFRKDGTKFWSDNTFTLIRDPQGQPFAILGSARDTSERKNAQQALQNSEKYFRLLIENNTDAVVLVDPRGLILYESPAFARMSSLSSIQRFGQSCFDYIHTEDRGSFAQMLNELVQHPGEICRTTFRIQHTDGSWRWIEGTGSNLLGESTVHSLVINMHDITERKQVEEALRQAEAKYHNIFENAMEGIFLSTPSGKFSTANPALARMLGYASPDELVAGMADLNRKFYAQPGRRVEFMRQLSEKGIIFNFESEVYKHDGDTIWISENVRAMRDHLGQIIFYEGTLEDITKRKKAEEEIHRRVAELEVLFENGLSISVLLDPKSIAQKMIEILSQKLDWHHASIRLYHPDTKQLELLALSESDMGPTEIQAEIDRLNKTFTSPSQGLSGWAITHGKPFRSGNVQADKRYFSAFPDIQSGLYVPLMIGKRAIGSIAVESRQPNRFSKEDERLLQTLAAQAAIAFENATLFQEAVSASKRKAALHQGGLEIVRAGQEIEALCIALHHAAQQVMPAEAFTVSLLTEDGLEVEAPYLFDRGIRHPNTRLPVDAGVTGRVIKSKKPLLIKDVQKSRGPKPIMVAGSEPTRAILSVPLLAQDKVIGVISAQSRDPDIYSAEDQIFLETLASEAAVAFENARLFEELRRRLAELESLSQVSISMTSALDLQPLLENILAAARIAIPAAEKGTILLAESDGALRLHAMSGYTDPRIIGLFVPPDQKGYAARVARERIPIKIDDAHVGYEIPGYGSIEEIEGVQSGIAAPLVVKGKVIGVISLDNASRKAAFMESDLRLLVTFASSAAVAIENARLFSETQQRLHRLSTLHSIDAAISASVDTHVTLSIVLEHIITELKADAAAVLLFNQNTRMLEYAAGRGFHVHVIEGIRLRLGEGLAGQSALQRRAINITDLQQVDEVEQVMERPVSGSALQPLKYLDGENFLAYHAIPLIAKGQLQGVLEVFQRTPLSVDQEWITFFEMLAGQTAIAIDNGRLFENLQHSNLELTLAYDATIQGWSQALELRDEETEGHTLPRY